ncbi:hypothetical protein HMPREF9004_1210 [Schaalia cardiffensis F0333]|uniref:Uncharacterized protein n=1 Tax=Schaalia cardiffensis F0333 TaxID=888050 RepID=N6W6D5_9ACTO|nr:hypothetical protein HMPREF9004_1210 [Schaalia cardiffensis F0333]
MAARGRMLSLEERSSKEYLPLKAKAKAKAKAEAEVEARRPQGKAQGSPFPSKPKDPFLSKPGIEQPSLNPVHLPG